MKNKQKAYILNYWWVNNYGAIITAYALQELLKKHDFNPIFIDNSVFEQRLHENKFNFAISFAKKYFNYTKHCNKYSDFKQLCKEDSIFISGSDQVFNPVIAGDRIYEFLQCFAGNNKKIAFSASFGVDKNKFQNMLDDNLRELFNSALKSFDFLSVRETSACEICNDLFNTKAEHVIDPVFLIEDKDYYTLIANQDEYKYKDKVVSYFLEPVTNEYPKYYHNEKILNLAYSNISVEEWLCAIKDCKLLITNSYHGVCFAVIFNKPFICIAEKERQRTRFDSLFKTLNIINQCVDNPSKIIEENSIFKINYGIINEKLNTIRHEQLKLIKEVLSKPKVQKQEQDNVKLVYLEKKINDEEKYCDLKYQIKKELWNLWLVIFHKYLPEPIKTIIRLARNKYVK